MSKPINFQELPQNSPNALPPKGVYVYKIISAQMKSSAKSEYLEVKAELSKGDQKKIATIYDRFFDSDNSLPRFKLRQFIAALNLPIVDEFMLSDLPKMIVNKTILADITHEKSKDPQYPDRAVIDVFSANIYYPITQMSDLLGVPETVKGADADTPISASDAADSTSKIVY